MKAVLVSVCAGAVLVVGSAVPASAQRQTIQQGNHTIYIDRLRPGGNGIDPQPQTRPGQAQTISIRRPGSDRQTVIRKTPDGKTQTIYIDRLRPK